MRLSDRQLRKRLGAKERVFYTERELQETIRKARRAFVEGEAESLMSYAEFLYQQSRYIRKRWWILQGMLLIWLWLVLQMTVGSLQVQRCMGIGASLFAVLLLPELWKNRNANAMEVESVSYYSLRQIYAARILAFAFVDFMMLSAFALPVVLTGKAPAGDMMTQFFLPYLVSCCICFRVLYDNKAGSEIAALLLCAAWCALWTQIVLNERIYGAISWPVWAVMTIAAAFYLGYCVWKGQSSCTGMWEERPYGIENV